MGKKIKLNRFDKPPIESWHFLSTQKQKKKKKEEWQKVIDVIAPLFSEVFGRKISF